MRHNAKQQQKRWNDSGSKISAQITKKIRSVVDLWLLKMHDSLSKQSDGIIIVFHVRPAGISPRLII